MSSILNSNEEAHLRQEIVSQCIWSETYSSLKHILKRTANQLPLLISFLNTNDDEQPANANYQTILFFDRNVSNKLLFTPLQQHVDQSNQFDVYPKHCSFAMTDLFRGLFEFVCDGQRCARIYTDLEQLTNVASSLQCSVIFMSRDRVIAFYQDASFSQWSSKKYPQGAIFRAQRIHRSSVPSTNGQQINNDYLECLDEDGYTVFIKMDQTGRFSLIATSLDQQANQPEIYLHSTQTPNIDQLIKRITFDDNNQNNNNCIRLVRGPVPNNFLCQYFRFVRQYKHDVLVGLTQEGLVIEWNLESHAPCRYATNLNDILDNVYGTMVQQTLETYVDQARIHYRENFQINMQLISTKDWAAFFQYWKWTGDISRKNKIKKKIPYQSRHRFHLFASIQDLSDGSRAFSSTFLKFYNPPQHPSSLVDNKSTQEKKTLSTKQRSFLSQMSKLISTPSTHKNHHPNRSSSKITRTPALPIINNQTPFDNSIYDSNQNHQVLPKSNLTSQSTRNRRHT